MEREHKLIMGKIFALSYVRASVEEGRKIVCEFTFAISIACEIQIVREGALLCHIYKTLPLKKESSSFFCEGKMA